VLGVGACALQGPSLVNSKQALAGPGPRPCRVEAWLIYKVLRRGAALVIGKLRSGTSKVCSMRSGVDGRGWACLAAGCVGLWGI